MEWPEAIGIIGAPVEMQATCVCGGAAIFFLIMRATASPVRDCRPFSMGLLGYCVHCRQRFQELPRASKEGNQRGGNMRGAAGGFNAWEWLEMIGRVLMLVGVGGGEGAAGGRGEGAAGCGGEGAAGGGGEGAAGGGGEGAAGG
jgi:hypothetical protein